jgi:hypothetical protein
LAWIGCGVDRFAPATRDYGLLALPLDRAADAFLDFWAAAPGAPSRRDLAGSPDEVFGQLEPLSMALDRTLLVANGDNWTSYFANGLLGSDVFLPVSRIAAAEGCTGLRVVRSPEGTIFEAYESPERGGDALNCRRSLHAVRDGRWVFRASGAPYSFEDVTLYAAKRVRDRFTPAHLDDLLAGLGAPLIPAPEGQTLRAVLFVRPGDGRKVARWTFAEVQAGLPWARR